MTCHPRSEFGDDENAVFVTRSEAITNEYVTKCGNFGIGFWQILLRLPAMFCDFGEVRTIDADTVLNIHCLTK